jgi:hypothetical protein
MAKPALAVMIGLGKKKGPMGPDAEPEDDETEDETEDMGPDDEAIGASMLKAIGSKDPKAIGKALRQAVEACSGYESDDDD